jgi:hypothetical protein
MQEIIPLFVHVCWYNLTGNIKVVRWSVYVTRARVKCDEKMVVVSLLKWLLLRSRKR